MIANWRVPTRIEEESKRRPGVTVEATKARPRSSKLASATLDALYDQGVRAFLQALSASKPTAAREVPEQPAIHYLAEQY